MAGTRTSGPVDGTPSYKTVSLTMIDFSGDIRSTSIRVPADATNADIESYVAAIQAASQASVWKVEVQYTYEGAMSVTNATSDAHSSVYANVTIGFRDTATGAAQTVYIPAPLETLVGEGDIVDTEAAVYTTVRTEADDVLGAGYEPRFARFSKRREINRRQPAVAD